MELEKKLPTKYHEVCDEKLHSVVCGTLYKIIPNIAELILATVGQLIYLGQLGHELKRCNF